MFTQSTGQSRKELVLTHRFAEYPTYPPVRAQMNYQLHYDRLIERARSRVKPSGYTERHHIVPRCLGGSDDRDNLVDLTAREHYVAHQLLVKLNPKHHGILYAALLMTRSSTQKGRITNRWYEWLRLRFIEGQSILMTKTNSLVNAASKGGMTTLHNGTGIHAPGGYAIGGRVTGQQQYKCGDCELVTTPGALGRHQKDKKHIGKTRLENK